MAAINWLFTHRGTKRLNKQFQTTAALLVRILSILDHEHNINFPPNIPNANLFHTSYVVQALKIKAYIPVTVAV